MSEEKSAVGLSLERLAIILGLLIQVSGLVWLIAVLYSSVEFNKSQLEDIDDKLAVELSDLKVRLRAAETEVTILNSIIDLEVRRKERHP